MSGIMVKSGIKEALRLTFCDYCIDINEETYVIEQTECHGRWAEFICLWVTLFALRVVWLLQCSVLSRLFISALLWLLFRIIRYSLWIKQKVDVWNTDKKPIFDKVFREAMRGAFMGHCIDSSGHRQTCNFYKAWFMQPNIYKNQFWCLVENAVICITVVMVLEIWRIPLHLLTKAALSVFLPFFGKFLYSIIRIKHAHNCWRIKNEDQY